MIVYDPCVYAFVLSSHSILLLKQGQDQRPPDTGAPGATNALVSGQTEPLTQFSSDGGPSFVLGV